MKNDYKSYGINNWMIANIQDIMTAAFGTPNPVEKPIVKKSLKGKTTTWVNEELDKAIEKIRSNYNIQDLANYDNLWNFCQFVRFAEKCLCYDNVMDDDSNCVFVDSNLDEDKEQRFIIYNEYYRLFFKLQKLPVPNGVDNVGILESLSINVEHLNGKKLENKFVVVNGVVKYNDDSDVMLVMIISSILRYTIKSTIEYVVENIMTDYNKIMEKNRS